MRPARPKPRITIFAYETLSGLTENVDTHMTARMQCRYKRSLMWLQSSCIEAGDTRTLTNTHKHSQTHTHTGGYGGQGSGERSGCDGGLLPGV